MSSCRASEVSVKGSSSKVSFRSGQATSFCDDDDNDNNNMMAQQKETCDSPCFVSPGGEWHSMVEARRGVGVAPCLCPSSVPVGGRDPAMDETAERLTTAALRSLGSPWSFAAIRL